MKSRLASVFLSLLICIFTSSVLSAAVSVDRIKVLILEDSYTAIPDKDEKLQRMGYVKGDLLVRDTHYTGNIEVWKGDKGLYLINELPIEYYVESVVSSEVGASWDIEALKAQAVIARTYAVNKKSLSDNQKFHLTSSVMHQVYKGNNSNIQATYAVKETSGEVLTYDGKPIEALYHSTCNGMTESSEDVFGKSYPYMKPVATSCELSPYCIWEKKIPIDSFLKALNIKELKNIKIHSLTSTGRVKELSIESESGQTIIKANELRKLLGWSKLPSTSFKFSMSGDSVIFEGKGYGHGVGLCQWCALQMAREGKKYRDILSYFYPGTKLQVYEGN